MRTQEAPYMNKAIAAAGWPRIFFYLIQFTWGLTVNLAGLIAFLLCRRRFPGARYRNSVVTYLPGNQGGLSLGIFLFISVSNRDESKRLCVHEYGHTIQCLFLGPLYWLVIAVPSVIWCHCFANYRKKHGVSYEALYCERWATAWGKTWSKKSGDLIRDTRGA